MSRLSEIKKAYNTINDYLSYRINDSKERQRVKSGLEILLRYVIHEVVCDETNNTPDVIDRNIMVARVMWKGDVTSEAGYMNLTFGDVEIVWPDEEDILKEESKTIDVDITIERSSNKVFLIDLDGTVCDDIKNEDSHLYSTANHFPDALEIINKWYDQGNVITFFTARESKDREVTQKWLDEKGFKYHGIVMDKPRIKDGQEYHWVDNKKIRATTYLGNWSELKEVDAKIQTFG